MTVKKHFNHIAFLVSIGKKNGRNPHHKDTLRGMLFKTLVMIQEEAGQPQLLRIKELLRKKMYAADVQLVEGRFNRRQQKQEGETMTTDENDPAVSSLGRRYCHNFHDVSHKHKSCQICGSTEITTEKPHPVQVCIIPSADLCVKHPDLSSLG